jgi:hypothetical protein
MHATLYQSHIAHRSEKNFAPGPFHSRKKVLLTFVESLIARKTAASD